MKRISFLVYLHLTSQLPFYLEHVGRLLDTGLALEWLLRRDLVVPQLLQLTLVILVCKLLVLLNNLVHLDLASGGDVVGRSNVHDPVLVSLGCSY